MTRTTKKRSSRVSHVTVSLFLLSHCCSGLAPHQQYQCTLNRREAIGLGWSAGTLLGCSPAVAAPSSSTSLSPSSAALSGIREQAARMPGYGQPDIFYPAYFQGSWRLTRTLVGYTVADDATTGGSGAEDAATVRRLVAKANALQGTPLRYRVRFFMNGKGNVVADRAFNQLSFEKARAAALLGGGGGGGGSGDTESEPTEIRWDPDSPNILTVSFASGLLREIKVTKRSFEEPSPGESFGSTEYVRLADTNSAGPMGSVPTLAAARTLVRYRATGGGGGGGGGVAGTGGGDGGSSLKIEGLELQKFYPPVSLSSDPPPLLTIKTRLEFTRE